jgi:hypothetical protein
MKRYMNTKQMEYSCVKNERLHVTSGRLELSNEMENVIGTAEKATEKRQQQQLGP